MTTLDDDAFLTEVRAGRPPGGRFAHADHIRLARLLVRREGAEAGERRVAETIRALAAAQGAPALYHETVTLAWCRLVAAADASSAPRATFAELLAANPELTDKTYLFRFYSAQALSEPAARERWIEPDLAPLPDWRERATRRRRTSLLRTAFLVGAATDALAVLPMLVPSVAAMLWGFDEQSGPYRFAMGYAATLMLAWTGLLLWAMRRPVERAFVAPLTVLVIYGLVATEIASVLTGQISAARMLPTWAVQAGLLGLFAVAYHSPAIDAWRERLRRGRGALAAA
jgi:hypothetical protein